MNIVLRTTLPPAALSQTIERVVRDADRAVPVVRLREMEACWRSRSGGRDCSPSCLTAFAGLALLLAAIGTYGVLSYMVAERQREIGIRMALGAHQSTVLAQIMKQGLMVTGVGIALGLAGAIGVNRLIASLLFGIRPTDLRRWQQLMAAILLVAAFACWLPAWRVARESERGVESGLMALAFRRAQATSLRLRLGCPEQGSKGRPAPSMRPGLESSTNRVPTGSGSRDT